MADMGCCSSSQIVFHFQGIPLPMARASPRQRRGGDLSAGPGQLSSSWALFLHRN